MPTSPFAILLLICCAVSLLYAILKQKCNFTDEHTNIHTYVHMYSAFMNDFKNRLLGILHEHSVCCFRHYF